MALGPGIYDKFCTHVRKETQAETAMVIVIKGNMGTGFSMQTTNPIAPLLLADTLRRVADELESPLKNSGVISNEMS